MMQGLSRHVHYLDITGEIDVFELAHSVDDKAHREGRAVSRRRFRRRADRQRRRQAEAGTAGCDTSRSASKATPA